jgi:DNA polymerase-3 subunit delta'
MNLFGDDTPEDDSFDESQNQGVAVTASEGLVHPRMMNFCLGHEQAEKKLLAMHARGQVPHGLMFCGPKGIGKSTMAYRFARFLLKNKPSDPGQGGFFETETAVAETLDVSPGDPVARRVASGGHSDLLSAERGYDAAKNRTREILDVAEIRKVPGFLRMTAAEGGWRVVIIDDADTMNRNAQNALLKILEEPPANALLILIAHRPGALIPTIRSRVQSMTFQPLAEDIMEDLLQRSGLEASPAELQALIQLSDGRIGKALQLSQESGLETFGKMLSAFETYPAWDWTGLHRLADDLGGIGRDNDFKSFQEILRWVFARLATAKARGQGIPATALSRTAFESILKNSSLEQLLKICENLEGHFNKVNAANLDKRQAVLGAFSLIA